MKYTRFLALLILMGLLSSCGGSDLPANDTTTDTSASEPETTKLTSANHLGSYNFNGATYHILGREYAKLGNLPSIEFDTDEETGDVINDVIYRRNLKVEEQYNVTIEAETCSQSDVATLVEASQMAGDETYDLVWAHISSMTTLCLQGLLSDYNTMPIIDISQPWWNQLATESLTVNGRCYLQMNYIPFTGVLLSHCLYFNKAMAEDNNLGDLYALVDSGDWTFDTFALLSKKVSRDVDGNNTFDDNDIYGLLCSHGTSGIGFAVGADCGRPLDVKEDGSLELTMVSNRSQNVLEKIVSLTTDVSTYMITDYSLENDLAIMFGDGKALFYSGFLTDSYQFFRNMEDDFGLLPFPKYDKEQENYITTITGGTGLLGIPKVLKDAEMVGVVTEALAIESLNDVYPAIYETVFDNKLLRDDKSQEMFDILMNGIEIDFGRTYKYGEYSDLITNLVAQGSTTLSSAADAVASAAKEHYASVIEMFYEDDQ